MTFDSRLSLARVALTSMFVLHPPASFGEERYRLQVGDVLELSVTGFPELRQRIPISTTGDAWIPLVGDRPAAGIYIEDFRKEVSMLLSQQVVRRLEINAAVLPLSIDRNEVSLTIAEYRPVFLLGDVQTPGEVAFRPGMSARQAIAKSGGYKRRSDPRAELDREKVAIELAAAKAQLTSIDAELGEATNSASDEEHVISSGMFNKFLKTQSAAAGIAKSNLRAEIDFLKQALTDEKKRSEALSRQSQAEADGAQLDQIELERINDLYQRGVVPASRATEVRRSALLSTSRALQTRVAAEESLRQQAELVAKARRLADTHRADLLKIKHELIVKQELLLQQLFQGADGARMIKRMIRVHRDVSGASASVSVDEGEALQPGDTVEVSEPITAGSAKL